MIKTLERSMQSSVLGASEHFIDIFSVVVQQGAFYGHEDEEFGKRVVFLGSGDCRHFV